MSGKAVIIHDFTQGNVAKSLGLFALPLFLSSLLQIIYNMVDMVIVGQVLGPPGLSAVTVGGDLSHYLMLFAMGFGNASQVIVAQHIGAGRREELGRFIGTMFLFLELCTVGASIPCLWFRHGLLHLMNTPAEAYTEALHYMIICTAGHLFISGYNAAAAVLRGLGDSRHPFLFISAAAILNVLLDILFVIVLRWGAGGAALATVISQGASFLACLAFLLRHENELGFRLKTSDFLRLDGEKLGMLLKLGVPMAIKSCAIHTSKLFVNVWINSYGVLTSAFAGIVAKLNNVSNQASNALNTAGSSMVGQNISAGKPERVRRILGTIIVAVLTMATLFSAILLCFPRAVYGIFTDNQDVLDIGLKFLPIGVLIFFGSAFRCPANALINGSGHYKINFVTALMDGFLMRIGLSVLFGLCLGMKAYGFWLGDAIGGFTPFFIGLFFYFSGKWKKAII